MREAPDLVILDLGLPDIQGHELLRTIRAMRVFPSSCSPAAATKPARCRRSIWVPMITSRSLSAWTSFWPKFVPRSGISYSCRVSGRSSGSVTSPWTWFARIVKVGEKGVKLSPKEYDLLRILVQHAGKVLTHKVPFGRIVGRSHRCTISGLCPSLVEKMRVIRNGPNMC